MNLINGNNTKSIRNAYYLKGDLFEAKARDAKSGEPDNLLISGAGKCVLLSCRSRRTFDSFGNSRNGFNPVERGGRILGLVGDRGGQRFVGFPVAFSVNHLLRTQLNRVGH